MTETTPANVNVTAGPKAGEPLPKASHAGAKVTVACKIPNGLILRVFDFRSEREPVMGGGYREVKRAYQVGDAITIAGPATPFGKAPRNLIVAGYAMTTNVDRDFWAKWVEQNKDSDAVRERLIFASEKPETAAGMAEDCVDVLSGLQPIVPDKDKRIPRSAGGNLSAITTSDDKANKAA